MSSDRSQLCLSDGKNEGNAKGELGEDTTLPWWAGEEKKSAEEAGSSGEVSRILADERAGPDGWGGRTSSIHVWGWNKPCQANYQWEGPPQRIF